MRMLLVTLEYPPFNGGVGNYYYNLAGHLPSQESLSILDNNKKLLDSGKGFFSWRNAFGEIARKIRINRIDYVLVGHILPLGTVVYLLSYLIPFRYSVFLHGLDFSAATRSGRKKFLSKLVLRKAERIIASNSHVAAQAEEKFSFLKGKIIVVNPGVPKYSVEIPKGEISELKNRYGLQDKKVILSLGRLVKRKGVDMVIKAMADMDESSASDLMYVIAGGGSDADYLKKLVPEKLLSRIIFLGSISELDKWRWLHLCDIFIMPARDIDGDYEGFGIVYLEANLCGKPVIAGKAGGVGDAVVDGYNGLLVDPENVEAIKKAILTLKDDNDLREKLGRQGRERAASDFDWEKISANFLRGIL